MRRAIRFVGIVLVSPGVFGSLAAQQITAGFESWQPITSEPVPALPPGQDTMPLPRRDYRYEGLAFGGIVSGAAGTLVGWNVAYSCPLDPGGTCEPDRLGNAVALGLFGAALGGGLGYLVGRLTSKPYPQQAPPTEAGSIPLLPDSMPLSPDSTRRVIGYQHWKGAAIGAGSGALIGALLAIGARPGCSDCDVTDGDRVKTGLVTTAVGGVFGFLVGLASPKYEAR